MKTFKAFACVGSHGGVYCTAIPRHEQTLDRFEIYLTREAARKNARSSAEVVEVEIRQVQRKLKEEHHV